MWRKYQTALETKQKGTKRKEEQGKERKKAANGYCSDLQCRDVRQRHGNVEGTITILALRRYGQLHLGSHKPLWLLSLRCAPIILSHSIQRLSAGDDWRSSSPAGCNRLHKPCRVPPARSTGMCNHKSR